MRSCTPSTRPPSRRWTRPSITARHILVATKDQADQVIKKLKSGAKFEELAKSQSTDTGSKNNGGELGWFTTSRMVKPFADAVKNLKKGEVTPEPVQTQYGWHVIQLEDTRDATPPPFDQVKPQLTNAVDPQEAASVCGGPEEEREDREEARCAARRRAGRSDGPRDVGTARRVIYAARRFYPATPPPASRRPRPAHRRLTSG